MWRVYVCTRVRECVIWILEENHASLSGWQFKSLEFTFFFCINLVLFSQDLENTTPYLIFLHVLLSSSIGHNLTIKLFGVWELHSPFWHRAAQPFVPLFVKQQMPFNSLIKFSDSCNQHIQLISSSENWNNSLYCFLKFNDSFSNF